MRYLVLCLFWVLGTAVVDPPPAEEGRIVFGVRISMTHSSQMTSFIAIRYNSEGALREKRIFSREDFIKVLSGFWPSPFNPKRINYFEQENVLGGVYVNDTFLEKIPYCPAFDSLWKIRYSDFPFRGGSEVGWSNGLYKPVLSQEKYLIDRYHIKHLDQDYFIDTNFWVLLRDISDSTWRANYRALK
ncbi:MAG: hypothetical protein QE487_18335 [Fluviicola sp.]|nr:hypothetical protein [Fluviicola sp.]